VSRIGKQPIDIPAGIKITTNNNLVTVQGQKAKLLKSFSENFKIFENDNKIIVERPSDSKKDKALHGLYRMLIFNMIEGISKGFEKNLEINGVGFSAEMKGKSLFLNLGFSHAVLFTPPEDIKIEIPANLKIKISGVDKQKVGQVAAKIREIYKPEPYKGKGIRYAGEQVIRKAGKKVGA